MPLWNHSVKILSCLCFNLCLFRPCQMDVTPVRPSVALHLSLSLSLSLSKTDIKDTREANRIICIYLSQLGVADIFGTQIWDQRDQRDFLSLNIC